MLNLSRAFLNSRRLLIILTLALAVLAPISTPRARAEDPPPTAWAGQLIYTKYYQDETYTGPAFVCEYNTCTGEEYCPLPKTPYAVEVRRITVSCTGIL